MQYGIGETAKRMGVSIRTLRYYDQIGLLKPVCVAQSGYRYYDDAAMTKLQQILFYRELEFPLSEIAAILARPDHDTAQSLRRRRELLILQQRRLGELIALVDETLEGNQMKQKNTAADTYEATKARYQQEAQQRWGGTDAWQESQQKEQARTAGENDMVAAEADAIFTDFASVMDRDPADKAVQALVARWQEHITRCHYKCTKEILSCLGEMYVSDERFTQNIDRFGDGLAAFMRDAIRVYCA